MGQQQLLLVVLSIVLVGVAVAVGIEAFEERRRQAALDQTIGGAVALLAEAMAYNAKPRTMGGNDDIGFATPWFLWEKIGRGEATTGRCLATTSGYYYVSGRTPVLLSIVAFTPDQKQRVHITRRSDFDTISTSSYVSSDTPMSCVG